MSAPLRIHLVGFAGIGADADRPAKMIEDNRRVGKGAGEIGDLRDLVVIAPGFKCQLARCQMGESGPEILAQEHALGGIGAMVRDRLAGIPGRPQADAAEPSTARDEVCIQHGGHGIPEQQFGGAHDARRRSALGRRWPEALMAAMPLTNSISPTGRMASGPSALNMEAHSMNTVDTTLWPLRTSARISSSR